MSQADRGGQLERPVFLFYFWRSARSVRTRRLQEGRARRQLAKEGMRARKANLAANRAAQHEDVETLSKHSRATSHDKQSRCTCGRRPENKTAQT